MTDTISRAAEEWFGIKADCGDIDKFQTWLRETYGGEDSEILKKVFVSGEAAGFLTVNETYFFREPVHFHFLKKLLPSFEKTGIRICCAAVATGCEAYSIAMLIETYNKSIEKPILYHIDAFDLNPKVIEIARQGEYGPRTLREDGNCFHYMTDRYLKKIADRYEVDNSLKLKTGFFVHNLMNELPAKNYDLVFFRNAFIYFTPRSRGRVLSNLSAALKEGGLLFMGVSETAAVQHPELAAKNREDVFYFEKMVAGDREQ